MIVCRNKAGAVSVLNAVVAGGLVLGGSMAMAEPAAPPPHLEYAFSVTVTVAKPIEQGMVDGARQRFIPITGGTVHGPKLNGEVIPGGGDWQAIHESGLATIDARYFLKAEDGTVIGITNPGIRVASAEVTEQLARGEKVDPSAYYFRTTPTFDVAQGPLDWLRRKVFVGRGVRNPDNVVIDFYTVE
jgi:hypothetical protein